MFDFYKESEYLCTGFQEENSIMKPYTAEELLKSAEEGRQQITLGYCSDIDDLISELDRQLQSEAV